MNTAKLNFHSELSKHSFYGVKRNNERDLKCNQSVVDWHQIEGLLCRNKVAKPTYPLVLTFSHILKEKSFTTTTTASPARTTTKAILFDLNWEIKFISCHCERSDNPKAHRKKRKLNFSLSLVKVNTHSVLRCFICFRSVSMYCRSHCWIIYRYSEKPWQPQTPFLHTLMCSYLPYAYNFITRFRQFYIER